MSTGQMVVLHLETGHVLAAASAEGAKITAVSLTGGSHLVVRASAKCSVPVPVDLLTALSTKVDLGVLVAPTSHRVVDAVFPLSHVGAPEEVSTSTAIGTPAQQFIAVWQVGRSATVVRDQLTNEGKLTLNTPPGGTHALVALEGRPLFYTE